MTTLENTFMWIGIIAVSYALAKFGVSGMEDETQEGDRK